MGVKFLNLQMIPWCFQLMGNYVSCDSPVGTVKLIKWDGSVNIYSRPIHASELMVEFPKHLVCRSDSLYIGQKIPALSEDDQLQLGHKYFLLPKHFFQSVLSFVSIASLQLSPYGSSSSGRDSMNAFLKKAATCQPFHIQKTSSGCVKILVSDEFVSQLMEEGKIKEEDDEITPSNSKSRLCTTPQLHKDYRLLVGSSPRWKPTLDAIKESEKRKLASFGMKRGDKSSQWRGAQKTHKSELHHHHVTSAKPPSKAKIKIRSRK